MGAGHPFALARGGNMRMHPVVPAVVAWFALVPASQATVLRVCNGPTPGLDCTGALATIQSAVDVAQPGDWILVAPGVYHEKGSDEAGVLIKTAGIHLRGMDRNHVIVDGTNGGDPQPCSENPDLQDFTGRNGVEVFEVGGTSVENLTVCNYLQNASGKGGNEIWFNGGDGTGKQNLGTFSGNYLTATTTYFDRTKPSASYGIFVSNVTGPGSITYSYASNMSDSDFYVGACPDCNTTLDHVHAQNSSLGYSGTNSGGHLVIQNSEWDHNKVGLAPNSLNNDDAPSPQSGLCPDGGGYCTFIEHNYVHDNNNPNVPAAGISGNAPVGSGIELSGSQFDVVRDNRIENQGAWGIVINDFPDTETPPAVANCNGGISVPGVVCYFQAKGNRIEHNRFAFNGFFLNPTNGDLANQGTGLGNCFHRNQDRDGLTSAPPFIEAVDSNCDGLTPGDEGMLVVQLLCASELLGPCPDTPLTHYPRATGVDLAPLPTQETTMANPCSGVPANPWCS
jgi:Right handed beta helix region